jgi:hypothetical protein
MEKENHRRAVVLRSAAYNRKPPANVDALSPKIAVLPLVAGCSPDQYSKEISDFGPGVDQFSGSIKDEYASITPEIYSPGSPTLYKGFKIEVGRKIDELDNLSKIPPRLVQTITNILRSSISSSRTAPVLIESSF